MGDGTLANKQGTPLLQVENTNDEYLHYLDDIFGKLSCGVKFLRTGEENALRDRKSGFNVSASPDSYSDSYIWASRTHPKFEDFRGWYSGGNKTFPEDIFLSPEVLKHWYVCDGSYHKRLGHSYISIGCANEYGNENKIERFFSEIDLPVSRWDCWERNNGTMNTSIVFDVETTEMMFEYMGDTIPGFKYKWPNTTKYEI